MFEVRSDFFRRTTHEIPISLNLAHKGKIIVLLFRVRFPLEFLH